MQYSLTCPLCFISQVAAAGPGGSFNDDGPSIRSHGTAADAAAIPDDGGMIRRAGDRGGGPPAEEQYIGVGRQGSLGALGLSGGELQYDGQGNAVPEDFDFKTPLKV